MTRYDLLSSTSTNKGRVEYVHGHSISLKDRNNINFSNLISIELIQKLSVLISDHSHDILRQAGVDHNNLIKIKPQLTALKQSPNSGKTEDFIDHVTGGQVDLCGVTETF